MRSRTSPEPWVASQHRTMSLWVSSMVGQPVTDFTKDLADGLVLYKLVNRIIADTSTSTYSLKPVYSKATFKVQKVENVDDVLKYCQLVLKINTTSISADNVVDGNLKLILGLIWTLFVYSTSYSTSLANESRSFSEVKTILLKWLNDLGRRRALPGMTNFDKDWSLQRNARPDLVFASILDFYIPNIVSYSDYSMGKKLQNLENVVALAWDEFRIPQLAVAEDFNVLVPDEKCIIFYILQWYMYFEVQDVGDDTQVFSESNDWMPVFMTSVVDAVRVRNKYDTRALRLVNHTNNNISKLNTLLEHMEDYIDPVHLSRLLDEYCGPFLESAPVAEQVSARDGWSSIKTCITIFMELLEKYLHFRLVLKPEYFYHDSPELKVLFKSVNTYLKEIGVFSGYIPQKLLSLESINSRLERLMEADSALATKVGEQLNEILKSKITTLDTLIDTLENRLSSEKKGSDEIRAFIDSLDLLQNFKNIVCRSNEQFQRNHTTSDLRALVDSIDTLQIPDTPETPDNSIFAKFKECVRAQKNQSNLTFSDARNFLKQILPSEDMDTAPINDFLNLIPTRRLIYRSESDDFSSSYASDDSEESASIFDHVQKTLEHKLLGNHNKLYDLESLVSKIDGGFRI